MVKKLLYFIVIAAELFVDLMLMISLWDAGLYIPIAIAAVAVLALSVWQVMLLRKRTDASARRRILWNIIFAMLIPAAVFFITYVVVAIAFIIAFAA